MTTETEKLAAAITMKLAREGKILEGGWRAFELICVAENMPDVQRSDLRIAYYAGCQHLWASMMGIMDPGEEPTDADMNKMELIDNELKAVAAELKLRLGRSKGNA